MGSSRGPGRPRREDTLERTIWRALRRQREERGISPGFAATMLGVDATTLYRNERQGVADMQRIMEYCEKVLKCRCIIVIPDGKVILQPIEVPFHDPEITTLVLNLKDHEENE